MRWWMKEVSWMRVCICPPVLAALQYCLRSEPSSYNDDIMHKQSLSQSLFMVQCSDCAVFGMTSGCSDE